MNEYTFRQFLAARDAITSDARLVFSMYATINSLCSPEEWEIEEIGQDRIVFRLYHHGEDEYASLPIHYFFAADPEALMRADREALLQNLAEEKVARMGKYLKEQEVGERRLLQRLTEKYGSPSE